MKKLGLMVLILALSAMLAGCWNSADTGDTSLMPTFGTSPASTTDPFMGDTAAEPMTGEAGNVGDTGVDPSSTDAPLTTDENSGVL